MINKISNIHKKSQNLVILNIIKKKKILLMKIKSLDG